MKRTQASPPSVEDAQANKRQKLSDDSDNQSADDAGAWTKVEKRKSKKNKKMETKFQVCFHLMPFATARPSLILLPGQPSEIHVRKE